jgi:hypothetical protein
VMRYQLRYVRACHLIHAAWGGGNGVRSEL